MDAQLSFGAQHSVTPITKDTNGARHFELRDPEGNARVHPARCYFSRLGNC